MHVAIWKIIIHRVCIDFPFFYSYTLFAYRVMLEPLEILDQLVLLELRDLLDQLERRVCEETGEHQ